MLASAATQDPFLHQEMIEILYHTLWETVHVFFEHRELGHDVGDAGFLYPFLGQEKQETGGVVAEVAASIRMKVAEDAKLRAQIARRAIRANRRHRPGHSRSPGARRQADPVRQWRLGHGRERLGARLRFSARRLPARSRRLALARTRQHHRARQRRGNGSDFSSPADRARAPRRRGRRRSPPAADRRTSSWRWKRRASAIC